VYCGSGSAQTSHTLSVDYSDNIELSYWKVIIDGCYLN